MARTKLLFFIIAVGLLYQLDSYAETHNNTAEWDKIKKLIIKWQKKNNDTTFYYLSMAKSFAGKQRLNTENRLFLENALGKYFSETYHPDSAIHYYKKALNTSKQASSQHLKYIQMKKLATAYNNKYISDSALKYFKLSFEYFRKKNDTLIMASILSGMATALIEAGQNKRALQKLYEAEAIYKATTKLRALGIIYDNIAMINAELGYEKKTKKYGKRAIALYQKAGDTLMLADAYANLGVSYKNLNQYDSALYIYDQSNALSRQINSDWLLAKNMHNIGVVHDVTGNHEKAAAAFKASLEICRQQNFPYGEFNNSINLGDHEMNFGDVKQAISYFKRAAVIGKQHGFDDLGLVYKKLHQAYAKSGNDSKALFYLRKYMHHRDSAFRAQKHKEIMELQTRYETQKKEAQILKLQKKQQKEKLVRTYLLLSLVGIVIIGLLLLMRNRRKRSEAQQNALKLEKENQQKQNQMEKLQLEKILEKESAEKYQLELQIKQQELMYYTLREAGINHLIKQIEEKLAPFTFLFTRKKDQEKYSRTLREITRDANNEPLSDFEEMFLQMHSGFYEKLLEINPDFTRSELQLSALLRMNLPSKEIAGLLNLALSTIDKRRHKIRKKLNLSSDQSLTTYLISL